MTRTLNLSPDREALLYGWGSGPMHLIRLWLAGLLRRPAGWWSQTQDRRTLRGLFDYDDHMLSDFGLTRDDIQKMCEPPVSRRGTLTIRLDRPG